MNLQVQPLKILATRQVVMNRMDYSTYLTGSTKQELDRLDMLAGDFKVWASNLTIEALYDGQRLPSNDWEHFKACCNLSPTLIKIIEGTEDFRIAEKKKGPRTWVLSNVNWTRNLLLYSGQLKIISRKGITMEGQEDDFIEDGKLVSVKKHYQMINGKMEFTLDFRDSIAIDEQGNIIRTFMCSYPERDIKITKVMWALRVTRGQEERSLGFWGQIWEQICRQIW